MAFGHGKNTRIYIDGYNLTGFFRKQSMESIRDTAETTVFGLDSKTYVAGLQDGTVSLEGLFDGVSNGIEEVLHAALSASNTIVTSAPQGDAFGNVAHGIMSEQTKYSIDASTDGVVTLNSEFQSSLGIDRMIIHHGHTTRSTTSSGTAYDNGASSSNGGVGYIHVTSFTGITNLSCLIQDSADGSTDWQTVLTFSNVTSARASERVAITGAVRQYTRARWVLTGTGSTGFWIGFGRK